MDFWAIWNNFENDVLKQPQIVEFERLNIPQIPILTINKKINNKNYKPVKFDNNINNQTLKSFNINDFEYFFTGKDKFYKGFDSKIFIDHMEEFKAFFSSFTIQGITQGWEPPIHFYYQYHYTFTGEDESRNLVKKIKHTKTLYAYIYITGTHNNIQFPIDSIYVSKEIKTSLYLVLNKLQYNC